MKQCLKCLKTKPLNLFSLDEVDPKKMIYCSECKSKYRSYFIKEKNVVNIIYSFEKYLRSALWGLTKYGDHDEYLSDYLGCTDQFYRDWIEFQFDPKTMSFENYGKNTWHVDHVLPVAKTDNLKLTWHWINFKPLDAKKNMSKGATVDKEAFIDQIKLATYFVQQRNLHQDDYDCFNEYVKYAYEQLDKINDKSRKRKISQKTPANKRMKK